MEDEQQHHHQLANYGGGGGGGGGGSSNTAGDLRHLFSPRPMFPAAALYPPPPLPPPHNHSLLSAATGGAFTPLHYPNPSYESMMLVMGSGRGSHVPDHVLQSGVVVDFNSDSTTTTTSTTAPALAVTTMPINLGFDGDCGGGQTVRWPRQETLTLLEVRSRLDHKFKEANHKGPLWDEVSRIMCDEHGYRRSGKKCREKFENLYKYYKKTKGGKAGRQDGKNYRFFRQLDALYGDTSSVNTAASIPYQFHTTMNTPPTSISLYDHHQDAKVHSLSLTNSSSELQTSSTEDKVKKRGKHSWKSKIKGFIDLQMRKIMERQDSWLEKMEMTLEHKEKERMLRDEEWRSQESKRMEREHRLWVEERAWMEARDRAMINALEKITGKELLVEEKDLSSSHHSEELHQSRVLRERENEEGHDQDGWEESEIAELIRLRSSMDARFEYYSGSELDQISLWEEIASRMASLGYDRRSATLYKEKWDLINSLLMKNKKMRENWKNESVGCSTSSGQQTGQSNLVYSYGEINGTRSVGPVLPDIGLGEGGGGEGVGGNSMTDSFKFLLGND